MPDASPSDAVRERPGCVVGIALGLLILGSTVAWITLPKTEARDGAQLLAAWFGTAAVPEGYTIEDARKLIGGEEVVKLVDGEAPAERERAATPRAPQGAPEASVKWDRIEVGAGGTRPRWLMFVRFPSDSGRSQLNRLFAAELQPGRIQDIGPEGGRMLLETGTLTWGELDPAFVLEREFERGGTFRDIVRVNMSSESNRLILHASWGRSLPFSKPRLQAVLDALKP